MYALLTLESTALMWSLLAISRRWAAQVVRAQELLRMLLSICCRPRSACGPTTFLS